MGRGSKKKSSSAAAKHHISNKNDHPLQAIVLADSFGTQFRPITLERPKMLLPLVNVPMLEYTLEFLQSSGVKEILLFCSWHANQYDEYIKNSPKWSSDVVKILSFPKCLNAGDALREIDSLDVVKSDPFILLSGDVVANINLMDIVEKHKARRKESKSNIMTMMFMRAHANNRVRPLEDDLTLVVDAATGQLLQYDDSSDKTCVSFPDASSFKEHPRVRVRYDLLDCHVDVCSPEMLASIADNYDYKDLRADYVHNEVRNTDLGYRIFAHEIGGANEYAARVQDLWTYDAISKHIIKRWTYPLVPDLNWAAENNSTYALRRDFLYREAGTTVSRSCRLENGCVLGCGTVVGDNVHIERSVIGKNCKIEAGAKIINSYLWDGASVGENSVVEYSFLCDDASVGKNCHVKRGCVLSFGVRVEDGKVSHEFARYTNVSSENWGLVRRAMRSGSFHTKDAEDAEPEEKKRVRWMPNLDRNPSDMSNPDDASSSPLPAWVGDTDVSAQLSPPNSPHAASIKQVASPKKSFRIRVSSMGAFELEKQRSQLWETFTDAELGMFDESDEDNCDEDGEQHDFGARASHFVRGVAENLDTDGSVENIALELNGFKFAENRTFSDCIWAILAHIVRNKFCLADIKDAFALWSEILLKFLISPFEESALLDGLERFCASGGSELFWRHGFPDEFEDDMGEESVGNEDTRAELKRAFPFLLKYLATDVDLVSREGVSAWADSRRKTAGVCSWPVFEDKVTQAVLVSIEEDDDDDDDSSDDDDDSSDDDESDESDE